MKATPATPGDRGHLPPVKRPQSPLDPDNVHISGCLVKVCYSSQPHHQLSWWRSLPKALQSQSTIYRLAATPACLFACRGVSPFCFPKAADSTFGKRSNLDHVEDARGSAVIKRPVQLHLVPLGTNLNKQPGTGVKCGARDHIH